MSTEPDDPYTGLTDEELKTWIELTEKVQKHIDTKPEYTGYHTILALKSIVRAFKVYSHQKAEAQREKIET